MTTERDEVNTHIEPVKRSGVIAVDVSLCLTCRECEVACSLYHEGECSPSLSRIQVRFDDFAPGTPGLVVCKQCDWPACAYACAHRWEEPPLQVDPVTGARIIDPATCHGCGACFRACPLSPEQAVIGHKKVGRRRVYFKCDLCFDRPEGPVCVEICPSGALKFVTAEKRSR